MEVAEVNLEPGRLQRITQSLLSLQAGGGLTYAAAGLALFSASIDGVLPGGFTGFLTAFAAVTLFLAYRYIPKYYERRFGHVEPAKYSMGRGEAVVFLLSVTLFLLYILYLLIAPFIGLAVGRSLGVFLGSPVDQVHVLIHDPEHLVHFGPILFCALTISLRAVSRRRDRGLVLMMNLAALLWIAFFLYPLHHAAVTQNLLWKTVSAGWLGISIMAIGLFQHMRVALLLPKRPHAQTDL